VGGGDIRPPLVDRGDVQSEQTGDGDRGPAALVPGEYREAGAAGVADAERGQSVVSDGGSRGAGGGVGAAESGTVGHGMVIGCASSGLRPWPRQLTPTLTRMTTVGN